MKRFFLFLLLVPVLSGCFQIPFLKKTKAEEKVAQTSKAIDKNQEKIEDKGKAFVYAANYVNKQETNRTPQINLESRFIDLAQLTLGNPSIQDAQLMRDIADGLLKDAIKDKEIAEKKLDEFSKEVIKYQKNEAALTEKYESALEKVNKINDQNAIKAGKWDAENSQWWNPFYDIFKLFKKLLILGLIGGVLFVGFHILEIFFPEVSFISSIFGFFGKILIKFFPKVKNAAGLVGASVLNGLKATVKGIDATFDKLKNYPIEQELLIGYPNDKLFNKSEVQALLEAHSERIHDLIKTELEKAGDDESKAVINLAKQEIGIKSNKKINF